MHNQNIKRMLELLKANGIETSEVANGGTDAGDWIILSNSSSCIEENLAALRDKIAEALQLEKLTIEARGDGVVLRGKPLRTKDVVRDISYADFFKLIGSKVISCKPFSISYLSHFAAPYTGAGKISIPSGVVFQVEQKMCFDSLYCSTDNEEVFKQALNHERKLADVQLRERITGVTFFLMKCDFELGYVKEIPDRNPVNPVNPV